MSSKSNKENAAATAASARDAHSHGNKSGDYSASDGPVSHSTTTTPTDLLVGETEKHKPVMFKLVAVARLLRLAALSHFIDQLSFSLVCREVREELIPLTKRATVHFRAASPAQIDAMCRIFRLEDISITNDSTAFDRIRAHGHCENLTKVPYCARENREKGKGMGEGSVCTKAVHILALVCVQKTLTFSHTTTCYINI